MNLNNLKYWLQDVEFVNDWDYNDLNAHTDFSKNGTEINVAVKGISLFSIGYNHAHKNFWLIVFGFGLVV